jgi:hypothetical protein
MQNATGQDCFPVCRQAGFLAMTWLIDKITQIGKCNAFPLWGK